MHYTGTIWRPPYEACSALIQVTAGCTHHKCKFCTLYADLPFSFKMSPVEDIESDLKEARHLYRSLPGRRISRVFLTGANPFVLQHDRLTKIAELIRAQFPEIETIGCFARITDISLKTDRQLLALHEAGYDGLTIGIETADDDALRFMDKGYLAADILEQCRKLDEAGIEYYFVYMTGLAGKGNGYRNAVNSARLFSRLNPYFISVDSLTLFPGTKLYHMARESSFLPAGEKERLEELQVFIQNLQLRTHLFADSVSNFYPVTAYLPKERESVIHELQYIMDTVNEDEMVEYRRNLKSLERV